MAGIPHPHPAGSTHPGKHTPPPGRPPGKTPREAAPPRKKTPAYGQFLLEYILVIFISLPRVLTSTVDGLTGNVTAPNARIAVLIAAHPTARNERTRKHRAMNTSGPFSTDT